MNDDMSFRRFISVPIVIVICSIAAVMACAPEPTPENLKKHDAFLAECTASCKAASNREPNPYMTIFGEDRCLCKQ